MLATWRRRGAISREFPQFPTHTRPPRQHLVLAHRAAAPASVSQGYGSPCAPDKAAALAASSRCGAGGPSLWLPHVMGLAGAVGQVSLCLGASGLPGALGPQTGATPHRCGGPELMEWWEESLPSLGNPFMPPCSTKARCCWLGWGLPRAHTHTHTHPSLWYSTSLAWPWLSQEQPGQRARPVPSLPWQTSTEASLSPPGPHPGPAASPPNPPSAETPWKGGCASLWLPLRGGCPMPWRTCSPGMGWARELAQG